MIRYFLIFILYSAFVLREAFTKGGGVTKKKRYIRKIIFFLLFQNSIVELLNKSNTPGNKETQIRNPGTPPATGCKYSKWLEFVTISTRKDFQLIKWSEIVEWKEVGRASDLVRSSSPDLYCYCCLCLDRDCPLGREYFLSLAELMSQKWVYSLYSRSLLLKLYLTRILILRLHYLTPGLVCLASWK